MHELRAYLQSGPQRTRLPSRKESCPFQLTCNVNSVLQRILKNFRTEATS